eukprot:1357456-Karenia_brevis.AAC.1
MMCSASAQPSQIQKADVRDLRCLVVISFSAAIRTLPSDEISFNAAISACEKDAHSGVCRPICDQLQRSHLSLREGCTFWGVSHDVISFSAAISACEKGRQWHRVAP